MGSRRSIQLGPIADCGAIASLLVHAWSQSGVWLRAVATADADAGARELAAVCHELWRRQLQRFERGGAVPALATIGGGYGGLRLG